MSTCEACAISDYLTDLKNAPAGLKTFDRHDAFNGAPYTESLGGELRYCDECGLICELVWDARDLSYWLRELPAHLMRPFIAPAFSYATLLDSLLRTTPREVRFVKRLFTAVHESGVFDPQKCSEQLLELTRCGPVIWFRAELLVHALFDLLHELENSKRPVMLREGLKPLYDFMLEDVNFTGASEKEKWKLIDKLMLHLSTFVHIMKQPGRLEPYISVPQADWQWLVRSERDFRQHLEEL